MTVYRPADRRTYDYDFYFRGTRYRGNTLQTTQVDAQRVEAKLKERLRHQAAGIYIPDRQDSPTIQEWSEVFFAHKAKQLERPEAIADILAVALRFWGRPVWPDGRQVDPSDEYPCYDLRLCDPLLNPDWLLKWEAWLAARPRPLSNQSKNHYRGLMRRMYAVAMLPEYRQRTGMTMNPFAGVPNDPTYERTVTLEPAQLQAWLAHASYHVRLAVAIAALAPKLRQRNILDLRWADHFQPDPRRSQFNPKIPHYLVVPRHKTARRIKRPLVSPITAQLLRILKDAWQRAPAEHVVTYRGKPVHDITGGVKAAIEAAGLRYGRDVEGGVTYHTLRHTAATLISEDEDDPLKLMDAMGHGDLRTTLKYRHRRPARQKPSLERLSRKLPIERLVMAKSTRPRRTSLEKPRRKAR